MGDVLIGEITNRFVLWCTALLRSKQITHADSFLGLSACVVLFFLNVIRIHHRVWHILSIILKNSPLFAIFYIMGKSIGNKYLQLYVIFQPYKQIVTIRKFCFNYLVIYDQIFMQR